MIRNVFIDGKISTLFVMEESSVEYTHPLVEALKDQAEKIELLEKQNQELLKQEKILLNLLEMSATTGDVMAKSLKILQNMDDEIIDLNRDIDSKINDENSQEELTIEES